MQKADVMRIGTASVNWGFDPYYTWAKTPPFERMLDEMCEAGYTGTEISYNFPSDVDAVRRALATRGLRAAATFLSVDLRLPEHYGAALAMAGSVADRLQALGSDTLILADAPTPARLAVAGRVAPDGSDGLDRRAWRALGDGLNRIGDMLRNREMRAVFHPHAGTFVETRTEIDRLCEVTDASLLGLCPDTGHLAYAGIDPVAIFSDYADRIGNVHLKDVDGTALQHVRDERIGFADAVKLGLFVRLGRGTVDFDRIFAALRGARYAGWVVVEQDAPPDPLAAAAGNRTFLRERFGT